MAHQKVVAKLILNMTYVASIVLLLSFFAVITNGDRGVGGGNSRRDIGVAIQTSCTPRIPLRGSRSERCSFLHRGGIVTRCFPRPGAKAEEILSGGGDAGQRRLKSTTLGGLLTSLRPWTWTAGVIPVLLTAALVHRAEGLEMDKAGLVKALVMVVTLQSAGNLINSVEDFEKGVDTLETAGDRTIVDGHVKPLAACLLAGVLLVTAVAAVVPTIVGLRAAGQARELEVTFWVGVAMVFSYTSWPLRLKYHGLGDITVFLLFGPMLMQVASLMICGKAQRWILPHGLPAALLCEAILHGNNMRDIEQDRSAGITTIPTMIGFRASQAMYWGMVILAYGVAGVLALIRHRGSALAFLTVPIAIAAVRDCKPESVRNLDETTAKLHMVFGVLMTAGTLFL